MSLVKRITGAADLASEGQPGSWVDEAAREKFIAAYERAFARWPQPCQECDVETATATTRVHAYRPHPGGEPVVLLTGAGGNAAHWYPHVAALAEAGPVYDRHARRREPQRPAGPDDSSGVLRRLAGRAAGQAQ
jgi:pimeloyl-ACP methyl ester carboxylesterase